MSFIVGLLTFLLVLDSAVLIFLVLIQLPKKEAGAGLAFGAGATDALFGAGSGTVLTKVTKYAAAAFFILAFLLAVIQRHRATASTAEFERRLSKPAAGPVVPGSTPAADTAPARPGGPATPQPGNPPPVKPGTNAPAELLSIPATNAPAANP
jgi:preprotein translocase subunit SecG